jgi:FixJ family two-component response regulator
MSEAGIVTMVQTGSVFVVEDEAAVRRSLVLLLRLHGLLAEAFASAEEFLDAAPAARPACVLLDIRLPGMSGLALQARMVRDGRSPPVMLMTAQGDTALARTALLQGASDFLEKPIDESELLAAVDVALRRDLERMERQRASDALLVRMAELTAHERALFFQITDGRPYGEIAQELAVALDDVEGRRLRLMHKLGVHRMSELFRLRFRIDGLLAHRGSPAPYDTT